MKHLPQNLNQICRHISNFACPNAHSRRGESNALPFKAHSGTLRILRAGAKRSPLKKRNIALNSWSESVFQGWFAVPFSTVIEPHPEKRLLVLTSVSMVQHEF